MMANWKWASMNQVRYKMCLCYLTLCFHAGDGKTKNDWMQNISEVD